MTAPLRVRLKRGRSKPFWVGHPWVYSGAIDGVEGAAGETGGPCLVEDERDNVLGSGFYNPQGQVAVRLLEHRRTTDLPFEARRPLDVYAERLRAAATRRLALGLPSDETNVYRLANAEGDGTTGLVVDRLGPVAVVHLHARATYEMRDDLAALVEEVTAAETVVVAVGQEASRLEGIPTLTEVARGKGELGDVIVREHGVLYRVDPLAGQKTGFYADQRESRRRFRALSGGRSVLDLYSYVGAFGLNAALGGATAVTAVEASAPACEAASENARLNGVADRFRVVHGDVMVFLKEARARGESWDRIVCDPPKLAKGRAHVEEAIQKYARVNTLAMSALEPGGLLLTCSCSQHVSEGDFLRMLTDAAHRLRKTAHVLELWGQPADHPFLAVAPEGRYLTCALVALS